MTDTASTTTTSDQQRSGTGVNGPDRAPERRRRDVEGGGVLHSDMGKTAISDAVVAKIAGVAAREVTGVHDMGAGMSRTFGSLRERIGTSGPSATQGVAVEVGERQAAIDLDLVIEYGASIPEVAEGVRRNVIDRLEDMTGLDVVEVNIVVDDVALGEELSAPERGRVE